ncbi:FG-GAP repeat domain-containing protein [Streptomyces sp. NPDC014861]|uniref:FG-GAP repeat domain-containing protein n=1 Tax=Streptomyces sp. NPDC014861 TaxID=3364923 RepID=UPI0036F90DBA
MQYARTRGRRLAAAAVTIALAATGGTLTALPASAAGPAAAQEDPGQSALPFPRDAEVVGAGPSGFLTRTRGDAPELRWTPYDGGAPVVLPGASGAAGGATDLVVTGNRGMLTVSSVLKVYDMARPGAAPVELDLDALGDYTASGLTGDTLLVERYADGSTVQYATTLDAAVLAGGAPVFRRLAGGVQVDCDNGDGSWAVAGGALYDCDIEGASAAKIFVDLATGHQPWYPMGRDRWAFDGSVSAGYVAWREGRVPGGDGIVAHKRGGPYDEIWIPSDADLTDPLHLVGGWIASGQHAHLGMTAEAGRKTVRPLTLQSIENPDQKFTALSAFSSAVPGPGGSLLVRGGSAEHGEGLYRISPRADGGRPVVELVASTGEPTTVTLTGSTVPTGALTGGQVAKGLDFAWELSRGDVRAGLTLTHLASGAQGSTFWDPTGTGARRIAWNWEGTDLGSEVHGPARAGTYEWRLTAAPDEGIGPDLVATGRFTVNRPPAPHDFDADGTADLLAREPGGLLRLFGSRPGAGGTVAAGESVSVGGGWQAYDRLETAGNIAGTTAPDVLARDGAGVLWLYQGTGNRAKPLSGRTRIGGGWQAYDRLAGGSDVTGDGRVDLVATDRAGVLWLYPGTGNASAPFSARKRVGGGWGVYNEVSAVGNLAGGPAGDLLARDTSGVLWLYLGKGDGTFAARTRIGGGWGGFRDLVGIGDADGDGRADLMATGTTGVTFYAGTGNWKAPLKAGAKTDVTGSTRFDTAF